MNAPLNAPIIPADSFKTVASLFDILSNATLHRQRLDELAAAQQAAEARIAELNAMQAETVRLHNTAQATNIVSENRKRALDEREQELDQEREQLETSKARFSEAAVTRREMAVQAEADANKREKERLSQERSEFESWRARIKTAMEG